MLIIGCDFHSRFQQIAMLDPQTGEMIERRLEHENGEARKFYAGLATPARVGMEATGYAQWFERMLAEQGHQLWVGDAAEIRAAMVRKQKSDSRDACHILDLLLRDKFPRIWIPSTRSASCDNWSDELQSDVRWVRFAFLVAQDLMSGPAQPHSLRRAAHFGPG